MEPPDEERQEPRVLTPEALVQNDQLATDLPSRYHRPHDALDVTCDPFAAAVLRGSWVQFELGRGAP